MLIINMIKHCGGILLVIIPSILFGQSDSIDFVLKAMPEGGYASYQDFVNKRTSIDGDSVLTLIGKASDVYSIVLSGKYSNNLFGIVLRGQFYVNYAPEGRGMPSQSGGVYVSVAMRAASRNYRIFVRVIKFGSIGLTSYSSCFKMSDGIKHLPISVKAIKTLIADDKDVSDSFKKSKSKEAEMYRFMDLYNRKHPVFETDN